MKRKRPIRKFQITHRTRLGELFECNEMETRKIIKQMEVYGLHTIGYGIDYSKTIEQHAQEQSFNHFKLKNLIESINRNI